MGCDMDKREVVTRKTALELVQKLSAIDRLKLVEHVLAELEPVVVGQELEKPRSLGSTPKGCSLTKEEIADVERKLWGKTGMERHRGVVQLGGMWKNLSLEVGTEDMRQVRRELSEAMKRRAKRH
jgi:hypothetical protein